MVEELETVDRALFSRLDGDSLLKGYMGGTLRLFTDEIPQGSPLPYLVMTLLSALPTDTVGSSGRFMTTAVYSLTAISAGGSYVTTSAMLTRIDFLLTDYKVQTVSPALYIAVQSRTERSRRTEIVDGKAYKWNGARYRILVTAV
jgi:hypothetical protein